MKRSPMPPRTARLAPGAPPARRTRMPAVNAERQAKEKPRTYGTPSRRAWVKSQPCAACGVEGYSENAHLLGNDGAGRKGNAETVGPLCHSRVGVIGCHTLYDEFPWKFAERFPDFDPAAVAARVAQAWEGTR